ncbi:GNAT family N-acetyltransferase [Streptomyces sp. NPDC089799]|uniref:GNAT family N-acetyltransferase n=1 Tax=Streptomyces sp. NPDC089799 TaxID=3155066 RepID=UPI003417A2E5
MSLRLEKITPANVEAGLGIRIRPEQEKNVESVAHSLAEAYAWGDTAWPRLIVDGDDTVGFLMAFLDIRWNPEKDPEDRRSGLWRLNIDAGAQSRGYGRYAVREVAAEIRRRGGRQLFTTWESGEGGTGDFYLKLGFRLTGETSGGQIVGVLDLDD